MLENTFTSIPDIARILFPFKIIKCLPVWFYKNQFRSHRKACRITQPTLFLSGLSDKLIPPHMMNDLYITCGAPVKKVKQKPNVLEVFGSSTSRVLGHCGLDYG